MPTRRALLAGGMAGLVAGRVAQAETTLPAPVLGEDGLYPQPWFHLGFLDLREDLEEAAAAGKRLAVMWEQRGCIYCKQTHEVNFVRPEIVAHIQKHFLMVQLNMFGGRPVTLFDGAAVPENDLGRRWGVRFTPTFQFWSAEGKGKEDFRFSGFLPPAQFLTALTYVSEGAYKDVGLDTYLKAKARS